jgi:putative endonuclease
MDLGEWGEGQAASFLQGKGYSLLARNIRIGHCELDLVMKQREMIVFVEVKTRISSAFGSPEEGVTARKRERLLKAAWGYLELHDELDTPWRIDVVAIEASRQRDILRIEHHPGAFDVGLL